MSVLDEDSELDAAAAALMRWFESQNLLNDEAIVLMVSTMAQIILNTGSDQHTMIGVIANGLIHELVRLERDLDHERD